MCEEDQAGQTAFVGEREASLDFRVMKDRGDESGPGTSTEL